MTNDIDRLLNEATQVFKEGLSKNKEVLKSMEKAA